MISNQIITSIPAGKPAFSFDGELIPNSSFDGVSVDSAGKDEDGLFKVVAGGIATTIAGGVLTIPELGKVLLHPAAIPILDPDKSYKLTVEVSAITLTVGWVMRLGGNLRVTLALIVGTNTFAGFTGAEIGVGEFSMQPATQVGTGATVTSWSIQEE